MEGQGSASVEFADNTPTGQSILGLCLQLRQNGERDAMSIADGLVVQNDNLIAASSETASYTLRLRSRW